MTSADIKCPDCGAGTRDVEPGFDLDSFFASGPQTWVKLSCTNGHVFCLHAVRELEGVTVDYLRDPQRNSVA